MSLPVIGFRVMAWILIFTAPVIHAGTLVLERGVDHYHLGLHMDIFEDTQGIHTIDELSSKRTSLFQPNTEPFPDYHFTSSIIWVRFKVENHHSSEQWYLDLGEPWLDSVTVFIEKPDGSFSARHMGSALPFSHREVPYSTFVVPLKLARGDSQTVFIRLATNSKMRIAASLSTSDSFLQRSDRLRFGLGLFFGIMLVMVLYNFFVFLSVRDISYLYYVLYTAGMTLYLLIHKGFAYQYLWPDFPSIQKRGIYASLGFALFWCCLFTHSFLQTAKHTPKLHKILWVQAGAACLLVLLGLLEWNAMSFNFAIGLGVTMPPILFLGSYRCWRKGSRPALYFLFAWTLLLLGAFLFTLRNVGILGQSLFTEYGMYFGSAAEIVLLSLGLADRINVLEREHVDRIRRIDRLKDQFLANTSHELRTPLNGIIGLAESLREGSTGRLPQKTRDILGMIISSGVRLHHLVNDILDFSKLKNRSLALQLTKVDPHALTEVVLTVCRPLAGGKDLNLLNKIPLDTRSVKADENRFQQILYNLIGNAIKFTDSGSVEISAIQQGDMLAISVTDTGVGISLEDHDRIFDFFEQADLESSVVGTGIGLAVSRQLVHLHGGEIKVVSQVGQGSSFTFTLPIASGMKKMVGQSIPKMVQPVWEGSESDTLPEESIPFMTLGKRGRENPADFQLLIVDDEHINRQVLVNHLSLSGFKTTEAIHGPQALQLIKNEGPFDMVILDVMMPKMSGLEVCQALREEYPAHELPIILLTALDGKNDLSAGFEAGANDYLTKPTSRVELLARVKTHLDLLIAYRTLGKRVAGRARKLEEPHQALKEVGVKMKNQP